MSQLRTWYSQCQVPMTKPQNLWVWVWLGEVGWAPSFQVTPPCAARSGTWLTPCTRPTRWSGCCRTRSGPWGASLRTTMRGWSGSTVCCNGRGMHSIPSSPALESGRVCEIAVHAAYTADPCRLSLLQMQSQFVFQDCGPYRSNRWQQCRSSTWIQNHWARWGWGWIRVGCGGVCHLHTYGLLMLMLTICVCLFLGTCLITNNTTTTTMMDTTTTATAMTMTTTTTMSSSSSLSSSTSSSCVASWVSLCLFTLSMCMVGGVALLSSHHTLSIFVLIGRMPTMDHQAYNRCMIRNITRVCRDDSLTCWNHVFHNDARHMQTRCSDVL